MNKIALAERLEGYSKIFASENPMAIDLMAMGKALRVMSDEKFASNINSEFDIDGVTEATDDKESAMVPFTQPGKEPSMPGGALPAGRRMQRQRPGIGRGRAMLEPPTQAELMENPELAREWADKVEQAFGKAASEENTEKDVEAGQNTEYQGKTKEKMVGEKWSKAASAAVLQNLVRDVVGMNKSICCDTKQHLTKEQMPDAEKKAQTPSSLKPDQTPDKSEALDTDMVSKANKAKPVNKEAGDAKGPGVPDKDGKGPYGGTDKCPKSKKEEKDASSEEHEEKEEEAMKEIADGLETAQEGLDKMEKAEVAEEATSEKEKEAKDDSDVKKDVAKLKKEKEKEDKAKKMEELKKKSQGREAEDTKVLADGVEFNASIQDIDMSPEEQKKLASLFQ